MVGCMYVYRLCIYGIRIRMDVYIHISIIYIYIYIYRLCDTHVGTREGRSSLRTGTRGRSTRRLPSAMPRHGRGTTTYVHALQYICGIYNICKGPQQYMYMLYKIYVGYTIYVGIPEKRSPVAAREAEGVARDVCHRMGYTIYV